MAADPPANPVARKPVRAPTDRFLRLLAVLLFVFLCSGLEETTFSRVLLACLNVLAVLVLIRTTGLPEWMPKRTVRAIFVVLVVAALALAPSNGDTARGIAAICVGLVVLIMLVSVLWRVFHNRTKQLQTVAGAVCAYLLFGLLFSTIYAACDYLGNGQFFVEPMSFPDYGYFSFTTLLTVGYGDFTVLNNFGRRLAMMEALTGQVFLATAVAQLISSIRPRRLEGPDSTAPDPTDG